MHKERIFSASSGRLRGASSGNMEPCPRRPWCRFSLLSAHIPIPPGNLSPFCVHRLRRGERGAACSCGTRVPESEKAGVARVCFLAPAGPRPGSSGIAGPSFFFFVLCPASFSSFSPVRSGHLRVAFLLRLAERPAGGLPPCGVLRRGLSAAGPVPCLPSCLGCLPRAASFLISSVLRPMSCTGVAPAIRDSPADSAVALSHLRFALLAPLRPRRFSRRAALVCRPPSFSLAPCAPSTLRVLPHPARHRFRPVPAVSPRVPAFLPSVSRGGPGA